MENLKGRDELKIYHDILEASKDGAIKRRISNAAQISYSTLNRHLKNLVRWKLIEKKDKVYKTTKEKGLKYLARYEGMVALLKED